MKGRIAALGATALLAATTLSACSGGDGPSLCDHGATASVTGTGPGGRTWTTATAATGEPPQVGGGYVLVRHPCSWSVLDLEDGEVVKEGSSTVAGVAGGFVYGVDDEHSTLSGEPVVGREVPGHGIGMSLSAPGADLWARVVDDRLYVVSDERGLTQYSATGRTGWQVTLPVLRQPTLTHVGRVLVATSDDGSVYGIDADDGAVRWRATVPWVDPTYRLSARADDGRVVVTAHPGPRPAARAFALDAATGSLLDGSPRPDQEQPELVASGEGWTVSVESDPVGGWMEE